MSTILFILIVSLFIVGYLTYGRYVGRIFDINPQKKTPAHTRYDGVDYVPARNWLVIFGHHFASIAGAGPIIGPVLAYIWWGWLGALIWIVVGTIFMGAVHDFSSLIVSIREEGKSIGHLSQKYISKRGSMFFLIFLWFSLIIVIAVFAAICAKSFIEQPKIVVSSLGLIPIAIFVGFLIYKLRINFVLATTIGVGLLGALVFWGRFLPLQLGGSNPYALWVIILFVYAFFASIIPVNILLQPRDYLASFLLFFGIAVAFIGLIIRPFSLSGAKLISFNSPAGYIFPMMFITIACGAISGFHSLVASGTTSKQLSDEKDALKVGYGAMILEGILAVIVLFCVAFGLKKIPQGVTETGIFSLGFAKVGFFLGDYGQFIALLIVNAFILTTLDTATRVTRFITHELFKIDNKWLATLLVVIVGGYFALTEKWQVLWPVFGASNQLVAGFSLIIVSGWLFFRGKNYKITLIPAIIMIVITIFALGFQIVGFIFNKDYFLSVVSLVLIFFSILEMIEFRRLVQCRRNEKVN